MLHVCPADPSLMDESGEVAKRCIFVATFCGFFGVAILKVVYIYLCAALEIDCRVP